MYSRKHSLHMFHHRAVEQNRSASLFLLPHFVKIRYILSRTIVISHFCFYRHHGITDFTVYYQPPTVHKNKTIVKVVARTIPQKRRSKRRNWSLKPCVAVPTHCRGQRGGFFSTALGGGGGGRRRRNTNPRRSDGGRQRGGPVRTAQTRQR